MPAKHSYSNGMLTALNDACKYGSMIIDTYKALVEAESLQDDEYNERKQELIERLTNLSALESIEYLYLETNADYLTSATNFIIKSHTPKKNGKTDDDIVRRRIYNYLFVLLGEKYLKSGSFEERKDAEIEVITQIQKAVQFKKIDLLLELIAEGKITNVKNYRIKFYEFAMLNKDAELLLLKTNFRKLPYTMPVLHQQNCNLPDEEIKRLIDDYLNTSIKSLLYILKVLQAAYCPDVVLEQIALFKAHIFYLSPIRIKELEQKIVFDEEFKDASIKKEILDIIAEEQNPRLLSANKNLKLKGDK